MKKFAKFLCVLLIAVVAVASIFSFAACDLDISSIFGGKGDKGNENSDESKTGGKVSGRYYTFDKAVITGESLTAEEKKEFKEEFEENYEGSVLYFYSDGTFIWGFTDEDIDDEEIDEWSQKGSKVTISDLGITFDVDGDYLSYSDILDETVNSKFSINYKYGGKIKNDPANNPSNPGSSDKPDNPFNPGGSDKPSKPGDNNNPSNPSDSSDNSVSGKVYTYDHVKITYGSNLPDGYKESMNEAMVEQYYGGIELAFYKNGVCGMTSKYPDGESLSTWSQSDETITVGNMSGSGIAVKVEGNYVVMVVADGYSTAKMYFACSGTTNKTPEKPGEDEKEPSNPGDSSISVSGKVYTFDSVNITFDKSLSPEYSENKDQIISEYNKMLKGSTFTFYINGVFELINGDSLMGYWEQKGTEIFVEGESGLTVKDNCVILSTTAGGITIEVTYKLSGTTNKTPEYNGGTVKPEKPGVNEEPSNPGENSSSVSGKVYTYDSVNITFDKSLPPEYSESKDQIISMYNDLFKGSMLTFYANGVYETISGGDSGMGYWEQKGSEVLVDGRSIGITAKDNRVIISTTEEGITIEVIFKLSDKTNKTPEYNGETAETERP